MNRIILLGLPFYRRLATALLLLGAIGPASASAQEQLGWGERMFEKLSHDFGVVAAGADVRYRLAVRNLYEETIYIDSVKTSCGCTAAKPSRDMLAKLETAYIEIAMDTKKFQHQKDSSVTVSLRTTPARTNVPISVEVRIPVRAYIRTDVVLSPGSVNFGTVPKGTVQERRLSIAYAGRENWTIRDVVSKNQHLQVRLLEMGRGGGRVNYDLVVNLKPDTPIGEFRDEMSIVTDDVNGPQIPVLVEGRVEPDYIVSPEVVAYNIMAPGEKKTLTVLIRGRKPFVIEKIESEHTSGAFEVRLPHEAKTLHMLPLTLTAPATPGTLEELFTVTIQGSPDPITFKAFSKVVASSSPSPAVSTTTTSRIPPGN